MRNPFFSALAVTLLLAAFAVVAQPVITQQPTNETVLRGNTAIFSVSVSGTGPFTYQWRFNETNNLSPPAIITTVAGNGTNSISGDGGAATNAALNYPAGVAMDSQGNLFIADYANNRVRKVNNNGIITTVAGSALAGNGNGSFSGDGGPATSAALNGPYAVAVDAWGNLFIEDQGDDRVRKVNTNGIITTVAGNGTHSFSGDSGFATNAALANPAGVAVDVAGNLYIADFENLRIRKVFTNGIITTVAGNGNRSFSGDGGAAINAGLDSPYGLTVDAAGNLFIADTANERIRKVDTNGIITSVAGTGEGTFHGDGGAATNSALNQPTAVAVDAGGNLFIADLGNNRIRRVDTNGIITTVAGNGNRSFSGDGGFATNGAVNTPLGIMVDTGGNLVFADTGNERIRKVSAPSYLSSLILNNVSNINAGEYSVVITGQGLSVTSSIAILTIIPWASTGTATLVNGFVIGVSLTDGGYGYTNIPLVRIIGGGGSGAHVVAVVSNGVVTTFQVLNAGFGYTNTPLVIIEPPFIPNPLLSIAPLSFLAFSNLTVGGTYQLQRAQAWYWTNQPVTFTAILDFYTQMVAGVAGSGEYRLALNPVPAQAFATPQVTNGFVVGATVTSGGSGYISSPSVVIFGGGGSNATAVSQISGGAVTNISITSAGIGYTNTPAIQIAQPPATAIAPTVLPVVRLDSARLAPYDNYQIQFQPLIGGSWENWTGGLFTQTGVTNSQMLFLTNTPVFFRLQYVP